MHRNAIRLMVIFLLLASVGAAHRRDFDFSLEVSRGKEKLSTRSTTRSSARIVIQAHAAEPLTVHWKVTRTGKDAAEHILVHLYVVRLEREVEGPPPLVPKRLVL